MERPIIVQKQNEVKELAEKMQNAASVVVVDYRGLTVAQVTTLRNQLREEGCEMKVFKNNISRRAAESIGAGALASSLTGPNAIAFSSTDAVAAAKILYNFAKTNEALELKAGIVDGNYANESTIQTLAQLPNRETLLTMLAGAMLTPLREVAIGLNMLANGEGNTIEATTESAE